MLRLHLWTLPVLLANCLYAAEYQVFFGSLHSHTSYSDGSGTPEEAYRFARDVGGLDFMAITEHNHALAEDGAGARRDGLLIATDPNLYNSTASYSLVSAAKKFTKNGQFVALYGQEYSSISQGNHVNVFEINNVITAANGDFSGLFQWLKTNKDSQRKPAIIQLNHPADHSGPNEYGMDDFPIQNDWLKTLGQHVVLIEILNGPGLSEEVGKRPKKMETDYYFYLNLGLRLVPTADQDNHYRNWGTLSDARTGILAKKLSKKEIMNAIRVRRVYATHDKNLKIWFRLNGKIMGSQIKAKASLTKVTAKVHLEDQDEPNAEYKIEILHDA